MAGAVVDEQPVVAAVAEVRVGGIEDVEIAVVVEVGGQDGLAAAAHAERRHGRVFGEAALRLADVQHRRRNARLVGRHVDVGEDVGEPVAREVGEA